MFTHKLIVCLLVCSLLALNIACGEGSLFSSGDEKSNNGSSRPAPHFEPGFNLFSPAQDVELGRQSAQQIESQMPLLRDEAIVSYVRELGGRLASRAPGERFPYEFNVVASREMNAFALPGGFIFVNAGALTAARNEGELAGVISHEIMHVALRHGTNQASKAYIARAGLGILGSLAGAGDAPQLSEVINAVGGVGANMLFLKFGRSAERQADLQGARLMAQAGYDPRDMANFFESLQQQGGQRVPEFLSDHPDPGNRVVSIREALPTLPVSAEARRSSAAFEGVKARLTGRRANLPADVDLNRTGPSDPNNISSGSRPQLPSSATEIFQSQDKSYTLERPANWTIAGRDRVNVIIAPQGGYGARAESTFVTHGVFLGTLQTETRNLTAATRLLVEQQLASNPDFRVARNAEQINIGGQNGLATVVVGPSAVSSVREVDVLFTTLTGDNRLFYMIAVVPEDEVNAYQATFERMLASIKFGS